MRWLSLAIMLAASPGAAAAVGVEEAAASERMAARAREALDAILGPGRAKVLIEVRGERSRVLTQRTTIAPLETKTEAPPEGVRVLELPGYSKNKIEPLAPAVLDPKTPEDKTLVETLPSRKDQEQRERDSGFEVKQMAATVVLDSALHDAVVHEVAQLLPQLLGLDDSRGDTLVILRAPLRPAWKAAFADPASLRSAAFLGAGALVCLLGLGIFSLAFVRAAGALGSELARRAPREEEVYARAEPLPELLPGATADLLEAEDPAPLPPGSQLGRRFDFLAACEPADAARGLAAESPADAALVFGYLAEAMPSVASKVFAALPQDVQAEVSSMLLKLRMGDPGKLAEVEERLKLFVELSMQGAQRLGRILSRVPVDVRSELLGRLTLRHQQVASEVERHLFTIEDLDSLSILDLRRVVRAVPSEVWGFALRGVPGGLVERVLSELPEEEREQARALLAYPQSRDKVLEARSTVLDARAALAAKGEIGRGEREEGAGLV